MGVEREDTQLQPSLVCTEIRLWPPRLPHVLRSLSLCSTPPSFYLSVFSNNLVERNGTGAEDWGIYNKIFSFFLGYIFSSVSTSFFPSLYWLGMGFVRGGGGVIALIINFAFICKVFVIIPDSPGLISSGHFVHLAVDYLQIRLQLNSCRWNALS